MANVEYATEFLVQLLFIIKIRIVPVDVMPCRRVKTSFAHNIPLNIVGLFRVARSFPRYPA